MQERQRSHSSCQSRLEKIASIQHRFPSHSISQAVYSSTRSASAFLPMKPLRHARAQVNEQDAADQRKSARRLPEGNSRRDTEHAERNIRADHCNSPEPGIQIAVFGLRQSRSFKRDIRNLNQHKHQRIQKDRRGSQSFSLSACRMPSSKSGHTQARGNHHLNPRKTA